MRKPTTTRTHTPPAKHTRTEVESLTASCRYKHTQNTPRLAINYVPTGAEPCVSSRLNRRRRRRNDVTYKTKTRTLDLSASARAPTANTHFLHFTVHANLSHYPCHDECITISLPCRAVWRRTATATSTNYSCGMAPRSRRRL